ncbi:phage major capsid protein [Bacillus sp. FJAT-18017]|uniref:phage major capsid protein n=1 Tax=Bacillus sp. FJAT-18017 TaxID=1705566 RepID=UPI0006AE3CBE|nr:phage major capsid protein [Bacillus sp. FJAT-18017]
MKPAIREMRQKRANLINQARAALETAKAENRDNTQEFKDQWKKYIDEAEELRGKIEMEEQLSQMEGETRGQEPPLPTPAVPGNEKRHFTETDEYRSAFDKYLSNGHQANFTPEESRALQAGVDADGGFTVVPMQFVKQLLKNLDSMVFIRQLAFVQPLTSAASLGVPTLAQDATDADWTTELATGNETDLKFGKREFKPNPLAKRVKVSNKLLRASALPIEAIVRERLAYKFAVAQEKAFLTGDGVGKPLGIFTASANGVPTTRDIANGNSANAVTYDGLLAAKFALKQGYHGKAQWVFHPDAILQLLKIKDGDGRYMIDPNGPNPDKLLNFKYNASDFAPNTFTTGQYVGALADFSNYWIADALDMQIQRLVELYAESNQTGFIGRLETDGAPALAEGFVRVKLG